MKFIASGFFFVLHMTDEINTVFIFLDNTHSYVHSYIVSMQKEQNYYLWNTEV